MKTVLVYIARPCSFTSQIACAYCVISTIAWFSRIVGLFCAILLERSSVAHAQFVQSPSQNREWRLGVLAGAAWLQHYAALPIVWGSPACCSYEYGMASGFWGGLSLDYALIPERIDVGARLLGARKPFALITVVSKFERFNGLDGYETLQRRFTYSTIPDFVALDVGLRFQPLYSVPLSIRLSSDATLAPTLRLPAYEQEMLLTRNTVFPDTYTSVRTTTRETAVLARWNIGITVALGAEFPFGEHFLLGAEASYRHGLSSTRDDIDWRTHAIQGAATLRWRFRSTDTASSESNVAPIAVEQNRSFASIPTFSLTGEPVLLQETVVTQTFPLLPYIFFDSASTVLRDRYTPYLASHDSFTEQHLPKETLAIYYHMLHIVGQRMRQKPHSTLTITGTTDGKEWSNIDSRQVLALQRAKAVAGFLTRYWGIASHRIKLATRDTPQLASSGRYSEGNEENRRVELSSSDPDILRPVVHYRFMEYTSLHTERTLTITAHNYADIQRYNATMHILNDTLASVSNTQPLPERVSFRLTSVPPSSSQWHIHLTDSVVYTLNVFTKDGKRLSSQTRSAITIAQNQYELSRLNLIVFDFDRDDMADANRTIMHRFVKEAIQPNSRVRIIGSTDRLGEARYNQELSESRARGVYEFMKRINPTIQFETVRGVGASALAFDNNLPEGRYYCRAVSITVQTPR
ncbi:MAG: OmpA family protein [Bacteroidota bacterium]|nr:OmpA family protein [Candidatus Kapabacteria bacterium]MDW8220825.1 OmpA family protein [Bacteroidota bacterium]